MKFPKQYIGGFFELESDFLTQTEFQYHKNSLALSNGRACLNFICTKLTINKIYVPFYTCNSLLEPLIEKNIAFEFYSIDKDLEIAEDLSLSASEYILYINYFGLNNIYSLELCKKFGEKLILDNTQSFFTVGNGHNWSFNSARKFFGVPDGAYLYGPDLTADKLEINPFYQCNHLLERKFGDQLLSYEQFSNYERSISTNIYKMSNVSNWLLAHLDMATVKQKRIENFKCYDNAFRQSNCFAAKMDETVTPFCYPLCLKDNVDKKQLNQINIFVPTLWQDVLNRNISGFEFEKQFSSDLLALPVDHRYDTKDCERVVDYIQQLQKAN
jgi:hypothetical protein